MKVYKENNQSKKSWSIQLTDDALIQAVDSENGSVIAYLIEFKNNGNIIICGNTYNCLKINGYNPFEHGNKFDEEGRIIIS